MSFKIKPNNKDGGDFETPPAGSQQAVCIGLIELGLQEKEYQGKTSLTEKVFLIWELAEKDSKGQPFVVGQDYSASLGKKANLRAIVEKWRGKSLTDDEEYDLTKLVGQNCLLSLVHKTARESGNIYAKIEGVAGLPKGMAKIKSARPNLIWEITSGKPVPTDEWLPRVYGEPLADVIGRAKSPEAKGEPVGAGVGAADNNDTDQF